MQIRRRHIVSVLFKLSMRCHRESIIVDNKKWLKKTQNYSRNTWNSLGFFFCGSQAHNLSQFLLKNVNLNLNYNCKFLLTLSIFIFLNIIFVDKCSTRLLRTLSRPSNARSSVYSKYPLLLFWHLNLSKFSFCFRF